MKKNRVTRVESPSEELIDFGSFVTNTGGVPSFEFKWGNPKQKKGRDLPKKEQGKRRLIGRPNREMTALHKSFAQYLFERLEAMGKDGRSLLKLPSSTGCILGSNHFLNASEHCNGEYFYVTDFSHAYPSVDLKRLTLLLLFILRHEKYPDYTVPMFARNELAHFALENDPNFERAFGFVTFAFGGLHGEGLAVGGNLSPFLLNLYCEVFLDSRLRYFCYKKEVRGEPASKVTYTRYVDDLVFSRGIPFSPETTRQINRFIEDAGFSINHLKTKILKRSQGTVFITKVGMRTNPDDPQGQSILVFPQKKRRRLHGIIKSYLATPFQNDSPEVVRGIAAEFLYYYKLVVTPTKTPRKIKTATT